MKHVTHSKHAQSFDCRKNPTWITFSSIQAMISLHFKSWASVFWASGCWMGAYARTGDSHLLCTISRITLLQDTQNWSKKQSIAAWNGPKWEKNWVKYAKSHFFAVSGASALLLAKYLPHQVWLHSSCANNAHKLWVCVFDPIGIPWRKHGLLFSWEKDTFMLSHGNVKDSMPLSRLFLELSTIQNHSYAKRRNMC